MSPSSVLRSTAGTKATLLASWRSRHQTSCISTHFSTGGWTDGTRWRRTTSRSAAAFTSPPYEMDDAKVQFVGDAAVLTFNFVSYGGTEDAFRWNCTEVYRRSGPTLQIIQTHWSFTRGARPTVEAQVR